MCHPKRVHDFREIAESSIGGGQIPPFPGVSGGAITPDRRRVHEFLFKSSTRLKECHMSAVDRIGMLNTGRVSCRQALAEYPANISLRSINRLGQTYHCWFAVRHPEERRVSYRTLGLTRIVRTVDAPRRPGIDERLTCRVGTDDAVLCWSA